MQGETYAASGPEKRFAGGILTVDLSALQANYRALAHISAPGRAAGVVKADAYGLGVDHVVPALTEAGCDTFFVALPHEGFAVRAAAPDARIFVLNGLFEAGAAEAYAQARLIPVLNSPGDIRIWETFGGSLSTRPACALNVDTGMNRLGLTPAEALAYAQENQLTGATEPVLLMSHLACADDNTNSMNARQTADFRHVASSFPNMELSLVNSAGILLGQDFHFDLTRPGIALYGGNPLPRIRNPMRMVVSAHARVTQIRNARAGETASYGATARLARDTVIAVAAAGYADGLHWAASGSGVRLRELDPAGGNGFVAGRRVPILGRVTMDLTMFDVTDCGPDAVKSGDFIEIVGPNIDLEEAATAAGTLAYEVLTSLGRRYHRVFVKD